jgi:hypothetical protein
MRVYSSSPLRFIGNRLQLSSEADEFDLDEDIYGEVWLPIGDDKEADISSLIRQHRITDY